MGGEGFFTWTASTHQRISTTSPHPATHLATHTPRSHERRQTTGGLLGSGVGSSDEEPALSHAARSIRSGSKPVHMPPLPQPPLWWMMHLHEHPRPHSLRHKSQSSASLIEATTSLGEANTSNTPRERRDAPQVLELGRGRLDLENVPFLAVAGAPLARRLGPASGFRRIRSHVKGPCAPAAREPGNQLCRHGREDELHVSALVRVLVLVARQLWSEDIMHFLRSCFMSDFCCRRAEQAETTVTSGSRCLTFCWLENSVVQMSPLLVARLGSFL